MFPEAQDPGDALAGPIPIPRITRANRSTAMLPARVCGDFMKVISPVFVQMRYVNTCILYSLFYI
jgi:hypothetical protein